MEGDCDGKTGEDEGGGVVQREAEIFAAAEGAVDQVIGRFQRIFTDEQHDETGDEEGNSEVDQRDEAVFDPARKLSIGGAHSAASLRPSTPAISRPSSPSVASGSRSPTTRPANMTRIRSDRARISSSSTETSRTALPWSRISMIRLWMNSMAPTS